MEKLRTEQELSALFSEPASKPSSEYASKPQSVRSLHAESKKKPVCPVFANVIQLKTYDTSLCLDFGFSPTSVSADFIQDYEPQNTVMVSSETAKQLLLALAELFQCELKPKP